MSEARDIFSPPAGLVEGHSKDRVGKDVRSRVRSRRPREPSPPPVRPWNQSRGPAAYGQTAWVLLGRRRGQDCLLEGGPPALPPLLSRPSLSVLQGGGSELWLIPHTIYFFLEEP